MRILSVVAVIITLLLGGYYYQWNQQAKRIEAFALQTVEKINAGPIAEGANVSIKYDALTVSGFPFSHRITVSKPVITSQLHAGIFSGSSPLSALTHQANPEENTSALDSVITIDGDISGSVNYFTTKADLVISGAIHGNDTLMGETMQWQSASDHNAVCIVDFNASAARGMIAAMLQGKPWPPEEFTKHLTSFHCDTGKQTTINTANQQTLISSDSMQLTLDELAIQDEKNFAFHLLINLPRIELHDEYSQFYGSVGSGVAPSSFKILPLKKFDAVGAQQSKIDMKFAIRQDALPQSTAEQNGDIALNSKPSYVMLDAKEMSFSNKLWNMNFPIFFEMSTQGNSEHYVMRHQGVSKTEPAFDMALQESLVEVLNTPEMQQVYALYIPTASAENVMAFLADAMPRFSGFGTIKTEMDFDGTFPQSGGTSAAGGITLKALNFITDIYSLKMQGSMDSATQEGLVNIACADCDKLVADIVEYNNRVQKAVQTLTPSFKPVIITTPMYEAVVSFLQTLNTGTDPKNLMISVVSKGEGNVTISGKPAMQVMMEAMQAFQPIMAEMEQAH